MVMDLSDLQALMGGSFDEPVSGAAGVWVVSPEGDMGDGMMRLIGKARVLADALGGYVTLLAGCGAGGADAEAAIHAGADKVVTAAGTPTRTDLADFFRDRAPQALLFPYTPPGRALAAAMAQRLGGSLCGYAADLKVDPISQRVLAHRPVLDDAAAMTVALLHAPAIAVVDTSLLPAAFNEAWRHGEVEASGLTWAEPELHEVVDLPEQPLTLENAPTVVVAGMGLIDEAGFEAARELAAALGGVVAGDITALDAGWIDEGQVVGLTGATLRSKLCIALGIDGDTSFFMSVADAGCLVAAQLQASAPIVPVADFNYIGDPADFARSLTAALRR